MGYSQHAGLVAVADGSDEAEERLRLCLKNDPRWASFGTQMQAMTRH